MRAIEPEIRVFRDRDLERVANQLLRVVECTRDDRQAQLITRRNRRKRYRVRLILKELDHG